MQRDAPRHGMHGECAQGFSLIRRRARGACTEIHPARGRTLPGDAQGACMVMCCSRCRIQHLFLSNFKQLVTAQPSNSSRPLCKTSPPLRQSTAPPNSVSPSALLRVCSSPVCSHLRTPEENRPYDGARWNPAVTGRQPAITPFTTALRAQPVGQLSAHRIVYLSTCVPDSLSRGTP